MGNSFGCWGGGWGWGWGWGCDWEFWGWGCGMDWGWDGITGSLRVFRRWRGAFIPFIIRPSIAPLMLLITSMLCLLASVDRCLAAAVNGSLTSCRDWCTTAELSGWKVLTDSCTMRVTSSGLLPPMRCRWLARSGVLVAGRKELEG